MPQRLVHADFYRRNWQTLMLVVSVAGFAGAATFGVINQVQDKGQSSDIGDLYARNHRLIVQGHASDIAGCERGNDAGKATVRNYLADIDNLSADRDLLRGSLALSPGASSIFAPAVAAKSTAIRAKVESIEGLLKPRREFSVAPFDHSVRWGVEHDPEGLIAAAEIDCEAAYPGVTPGVTPSGTLSP